MTKRALCILALCGSIGCSDSGDGGGGDGDAAGSGTSSAGNGSSGSGSGNAGNGSSMSGNAGNAPAAGDGGGAGTTSSGGAGTNGSGSAGSGSAGSGSAGSGAAGSGEPSDMTDPPPAAPMSFEDAQQAIADYAAAHPGMDGDVLYKTPAQLDADPAAKALRELCGEGAVPVIPQLAWEYGGSDHAWLSYEMSALVYCVYLPVSPNSEHWSYDAADDHVTVDVFVLYPEDNPCADATGADQVTMCIGDPSNFEILVDTASMNDGHDVGLELSESSTDLYLVLPNGERVHLFFGA
jgi:hypothetical protein